MLNLEHIRQLCTGGISISEPLAPLTSFRIGGPADIYLEPSTTDELVALVRYFRVQEVSYILLGNGSNILISDEGYRGAALSIEKGFSSVTLDGDTITAGAGIRLSTFVDFAITHNFAGVEMLAGIPGTLGGGVIMNAGAYGGEISDHLLDVTVLRGTDVRTLSRDACNFRYRNSDLKEDIVLSARFRFPRGDAQELRRRRKELLLKRNAAQPVKFPNAGSIFKNPEGDFAARLIESSGLKGQRFGGAVVSELHANFIVNDSGATANDVVALINRVRRIVFETTGVVLEPEIQFIGFSADPLDPLPLNRQVQA
ncbi:MAG: UDP-N-acetylmuramate dehydrogenase [Bacteroidia bacterium]|nr:UDP-N-acetylmuramate dehydrogenase [Bacteroidia bacterium]